MVTSDNSVSAESWEVGDIRGRLWGEGVSSPGGVGREGKRVVPQNCSLLGSASRAYFQDLSVT